MMDKARDRFGELLSPLQDVWSLYQRLAPEQQRSALLLVAIGVAALVVWGAYQAHGDRVVVVLPAGMLRIALLMLVLPVVLLGKVAGRGTSVPDSLTKSWTAEPDPERAKIPIKAVNPMKLPGGLSTNNKTSRQRRSTR